MGERNVIKRGVELNADNVDWYMKHYPKGSLSPMISMLFDKFCEIHKTTPAEYAELAAQELTEDLNRAIG